MKTYKVSCDNEWGKKVWTVIGGGGVFGRYSTKTAAIKDCRTYGIKLVEA